MKPAGKLCTTAVLAMVCLARPAGAEPVADAERLQLADGLYSRGMYELAAQEYKAFLRDFPDSKQADVVFFRMGESYRQMGELAEADKVYRHVFVSYPQSELRFKAGFRRADIFMGAGKYEAAIDLFQAVLDQNPPADMTAACLYFMGDSLIKTGQGQRAVAALEKVRSRHQSSKFLSYALLKLGSLYGAQAVGGQAKPAYADPNKALQLYQLAISKAATKRVAAEALFQVAEIHFRNKDFKKSAEAYGRLLNNYPDDQRSAEARLQAAWAAHNAGLYAEALRTADGTLATAAAEDKPDWLYLKASCERLLIRNDSAVATYARLLDEFPDSRFTDAARYERALTFYRMGDFKSAAAEARQVRLVAGMKQDVYWLLAESYAALKQNDDAIQYYRLITSEFPDTEISRDATYRLAYQLQQRKQFKEASRYYRTLVERFPDSQLAPQALFASGLCLARENLHEDAVRDWATLLKKYPSDPRNEEALYRKAMSEIRLERDQQALESLREFQRKYRDSKYAADIYYWQGIVLKTGGKLHDAEGALRQALKSKPRSELVRDINFHLGMVLYKAERLDQAADLLQPLVATPLRDKFPPSLLEWLCEFRYEKKRFDDVLAVAKLLVEEDNRDTTRQTGFCLLGRAYQAKGNQAEAEKAFTAALELPGTTGFSAEAALRLGDIKLATGDLAPAERYFSRAATLSADDSLLGVRAKAYSGLAQTALKRSKPEEAARYFMSVAILYEDDELVPKCLHGAAQAFRAAGREEERKRAVAELVKRYPNSEWTRKATEADK
jgi:TolA-binding protein